MAKPENEPDSKNTIPIAFLIQVSQMASSNLAAAIENMIKPRAFQGQFA
jgi:hypothetical protein